MAQTTLEISLFDPGMSAMHRAGLGGLAMSIDALRDELPPGLCASYRRDTVTLRFDEDDARALVSFVEAAMYCEKGLIKFAAYRNQSPVADLHMNECLLGTLLQHNKMLEPDGAKKIERSVDVDGVPIVHHVKQLTNFVHRYTAGQKLIDADGRLTVKPIEIKGWAIPGAVQRHSKLAATTIFEPPERLLPLLFAPVGVVPMRVVGNAGTKHRFVLLIPEVDSLEQFVKRRKKVRSAKDMLCAGPGDASLRFFTAIKGSKMSDKLRTHCTATTLGKVTWSSQQMTRTDVLELDMPDDRTLDAYDIVNERAPFTTARTAKGQGFRTAPTWRHFLTENLAAGRKLWAGLHHVTAVDPNRRKRMLEYEARTIKEIVKHMVDKNLLGSETEQRFVEAWHQAIRQRWGALGERIRKEHIVAERAYARDFEEMRVALARCKNADSFRAAVVDLWARAGRNAVLAEHWRDVLAYLNKDNWQLGRDLALLALASYRGKGQLEQPNTDDETEEQEIDQ